MKLTVDTVGNISIDLENPTEVFLEVPLDCTVTRTTCVVGRHSDSTPVEAPYRLGSYGWYYVMRDGETLTNVDLIPDKGGPILVMKCSVQMKLPDYVPDSEERAYAMPMEMWEAEAREDGELGDLWVLEIPRRSTLLTIRALREQYSWGIYQAKKFVDLVAVEGQLLHKKAFKSDIEKLLLAFLDAGVRFEYRSGL